MENLNDKNQKQEDKDEIKISKKSLYIAFSIVGVLIFLGVGYFLVSNKNKHSDKNSLPHNDSAFVNKDSADIVKKDSVKGTEYDGEYEPYTSYRVISDSFTLPNGRKLSFGDEVFLDEEKSSADSRIIYLNNPHKVPSTKDFPISVNEEILIDSYNFTEFKNSFSLPPFSSLPPAVKKVILEADGYHDGRTYKVTQNINRAKSTFSTGDFDGDGVKDFAVIMDDNEGKVSRLVIISINKITQKPYVSFAENYNDILKLKSFSKGASIYMNSSAFLKAPRDGVLISNEVSGLAVIYDTDAQKYKAYEQQPITTDYEEE